MQIEETGLPGVLGRAGVQLPEFAQDNRSSAQAGTLRGLHCQAQPHTQGKLVRCGRGRMLDAFADWQSTFEVQA